MSKTLDVERLLEVAKTAERYLVAELDFLKYICSIDCGTRNLEWNKKVVEYLNVIKLTIL